MERYLDLLPTHVRDDSDKVDLRLLRLLWFQNDGPPPHNCRLVTDFLTEEFDDIKD